MPTPVSNLRQQLDGIAKTLSSIGDQAAKDPAFKEELRKNQVAVMRAAGLSVAALVRVLMEHSVTEAQIGVYTKALGALRDDDNPPAFTLSNMCIGTCKDTTIWVCGGTGGPPKV